MTSTPVQRTEYDVGNRLGYGYSGVRVYHHVVIRDLSSSGASAHSRYLYGVVSSGSEPLSGFLPTVEQGGQSTHTAQIACIHSRVRTRVRKVLYQDIAPPSSNTVA